MRLLSLRNLANAVLCTLAEVGEAPEGILCAGIMTKGANLDDFYYIKGFLLRYGLATEEPGPILRATDKLHGLYQKAKKQETQGGETKCSS